MVVDRSISYSPTTKEVKGRCPSNLVAWLFQHSKHPLQNEPIMIEILIKK
jgi:hypothetical protein